MTGQTLEQKRASFALKCVQGIREKKYDHYVSYVSALPATVVSNGLGQALVMLLAKDKGKQNSPYWMLYSHVAQWLSQQVSELKTNSEAEVIDKLLDSNQSVYIRAQAEAMAYLNWLKQFSRAYLRETMPNE